MRKESLLHLAPAALLTAVLIWSQSGTAWANTPPSPQSASQGHWEQTGETWKYYNEAGTLETGWVHTSSGWYYLSPQDGTMLTGWQDIDGKRFYLNTSLDGTAGEMRNGWFQTSDGSWYFLNTAHDGDFGSTLTGWQWIDGHCYYLGASEGADKGKMHTKGRTPDGYLIDEQGRWANRDGAPHHMPGKGLPSSDSAAASGSGSNKNVNSNRGNNKRITSGSKHSGGGGHRHGAGSQNSSNSNHPNTVPELKENEAAALINEAKTKLINLGWIQYVVITFESGSLDDYSVSADGTDITHFLLPVDDAKTVVKWETTALNPGSVTVDRNSDHHKQTVRITNTAPAKAPEPGSMNGAPSDILTNGPVSRFDYYLDVYDKNGRVRTIPQQTTFDLSGQRNQKAAEIPTSYYAPDAFIDEYGNGELVLKLALKTAEQKAWFEAISRLKVLDPENSTLNGNPAFSRSIEETYGTTGVLKINLPQTNLFSRGRYQINIRSDYSEAAMTLPIHLVDSRTFTMKLNTFNLNPRPGEDFAFTITGDDGSTFGNEILSPIYRVDLTSPSGETKSLEKISEWYEIGDLLHICGTSTEEKAVTKESGTYTVTVYANGYQTMKKAVEIGEPIMVFSTLSKSGVDAVSSATVSGSSASLDDSGSSAGGMMNAFLIFNHDLISNALILNELGMANEAVDAVLDRWSTQTPIAVTDSSDQLYDFITYLNDVKDARLEGKYLSFLQYAEMGKGLTQNRPYQVKLVLEDGLLGSSMQYSWLEGKQPPVLDGTSGALGEDLVLSSTDSLYFNPGIQLYLDGSAVPLRNDDDLKQYLLNSETGTLTIYSSGKGTMGGALLLTPGEHELRLISEGYQTNILVIKIIKTPEAFDLALVNPNPEADAAAMDASVYYTGQNVYIKAAADETGADDSLRGDFMRLLEKIELKNPEGITSMVTSNQEGALYGDDNYVPGEFSFILQKGLFKTEGIYQVTVRAKGYTPKTLEFHIEKAAETEGIPTELEAPQVSDVVYVNGSFGGDPYYRVSFDDAAGTLEAYLKTVGGSKAAVTVMINETLYGYAGLPFRDDIHKYKTSKDDYANWKYLDLTADGFRVGDNTISIAAEGYRATSYTMRVDGPGENTPAPNPGTAGDNTEVPVNPAPVPGENDSEIPSDQLGTPAIGMAEYHSGVFDNYYRISFESTTVNELDAYLHVIEDSKATIQVNGSPYSYSSYLTNAKYKVSKDGYANRKYLDFSADGFREGDNTISIEAEGYPFQSFDMWIDADKMVTAPKAAASVVLEASLTEPSPENAQPLLPSETESAKSKDSRSQSDTPDIKSEDHEASVKSDDETAASRDEPKEDVTADSDSDPKGDTALEDSSKPTENIIAESDSTHGEVLTDLPA